MLFNSIDFAIFLPIVFLLYWFVTAKSLKAQNVLIVTASLVFYGWWDWRFLSLLLFSSLVDYFAGAALKRVDDPAKRKWLLAMSLACNLGLLGFFKYFNFFVDSFVSAFTFFGMHAQARSLNIILPVGISFYTFQTLSYTIDVYRRELKATDDFIAFLAFVGFFPQLVAGPIERAANLLPQFYKPRVFDRAQAVDGLRQALWGLFKKVIIADKCAEFANIIFNNYTDYSGSTLLLGAVFFAFQIYGDFSGYSDIAIGVARLFGFTLMKNFAFPYFSRDIAEFWRRWHISLSTWFRDYLYIPLGGSKRGTLINVRNTFIIFLVSGFWHGANWTFVFWGFINALYFLPLLLFKWNRKNLDTIASGKALPSIKEFVSMTITFALTCLAWVSFRAQSIGQAFSMYKRIFSKTFFTIPFFPWRGRAFGTLVTVLLFMIIEWFGREREYAIEKLGFKAHWAFRWAFYLVVCATVFINIGQEQQFIYFQF